MAGWHLPLAPGRLVFARRPKADAATQGGLHRRYAPRNDRQGSKNGPHRGQLSVFPMAVVQTKHILAS
jgi:hypothetical protein